MSRLKQLIGEVHRRSLWQVLLIYIGAAWACFELIATVADTMGLPTWLPGLAIALFLLGLPFVVATAFVREAVAPPEEGAAATEAVRVEAERKAAVERRRFLTWRNAGLSFVTVLAVWGVVAAGWMLFGSGEALTPEVAAERPSIAALPFENRSGLEEDLYFTDGIHDEILTQLTKISGLSVRARTSVMEYRDSPKNVRQIGRELNARYILEGGVQRAGGSVRINLQLLDTERDEHVWAEMYDRPLTVENLLAVQSEVALRVAEALKATLTAEEAERIEQRPTDNTEAYDYYLRGNQYAVGDEASQRIAVEMYERAVELDPSFALAYAKLSVTHGRIYREYYDHSENRRMQAKEAVDRVIALGPESPEAHEALGTFYYFGRDYERAAAEFNKILSKQPGNSEALAALSFMRRRQGDFEGSVTLLKRALELDPRNPRFLRELGLTYTWLRNYEQAGFHYERAIELRPDWPTLYTWYGYLKLVWLGAPDSARAVLEQASRKAGPADDDHHWVWTRVELCDRDLEGALHRVEQAPDVLEDQASYLPRALLYGEAHDLLGDSDLAREYYDSARAFLEPKVLEQPGDWRRHSALGVAYAGLGRSEEAIREGRLAVELMPVARDALAGSYPVGDLARVYVMVGEYDAAIDQLDYLLSIPAGKISVPLLRIDPAWDPLRDNPRFQALLEK